MSTSAPSGPADEVRPTPATTPCPTCGRAWPEDARWCGACGAPMDGSRWRAAVARARRAGAERGPPGGRTAPGVPAHGRPPDEPAGNAPSAPRRAGSGGAGADPVGSLPVEGEHGRRARTTGPGPLAPGAPGSSPGPRGSRPATRPTDAPGTGPQTPSTEPGPPGTGPPAVGDGRRPLAALVAAGLAVLGIVALSAIDTAGRADDARDQAVDLPTTLPAPVDEAVDDRRGRVERDPCTAIQDWCLRLPLPVQGVAAAPEGLLAVTTTHGVVVVDAATGDVRWERQVIDRIGSDVQVVQPFPGAGLRGAVVVAQGPFTGALGLDAERGDVLWTAPGAGPLHVSADLLVGVELEGRRRWLVAREPRGLAVVWRVAVEDATARIVAADARDVVLADGPALRVVDGLEGEERYRVALEGGSVNPPAVLGPTSLFLVDGPFGDLRAHDRVTGDERWRVSGQAMPSDMAAREGELLMTVGLAGRVLDEADGTELATLELPGFGPMEVEVSPDGVATWHTEAAFALGPATTPNASRVRLPPGVDARVVGDLLVTLDGEHLAVTDWRDRVLLEAVTLTPPSRLRAGEAGDD